MRRSEPCSLTTPFQRTTALRTSRIAQPAQARPMHVARGRDRSGGRLVREGTRLARNLVIMEGRESLMLPTSTRFDADEPTMPLHARSERRGPVDDLQRCLTDLRQRFASDHEADL